VYGGGGGGGGGGVVRKKIVDQCNGPLWIETCRNVQFDTCNI